MPRKTRKTHYKSFSITDKDEEILDIYINEKNFLSKSEALRHCIQYSFDKEFPSYVYKTTPAAEIKKRQLDKIKQFEQLTPEEYALSLGALVLTSQEGTKWAFFHQIGNSIKGFLVDDIKTLHEDFAFKNFITYHKSILEERSIQDIIKSSKVYWIPHLLEEYDIVYEPDERDDNQDSGLSTPQSDSGLASERSADSSDERRPLDRLSSGEQGGSTRHSGDNSSDGENTDGGSEDGEGSSEAGTESVSGDSTKLRSHGPNS